MELTRKTDRKDGNGKNLKPRALGKLRGRDRCPYDEFGTGGRGNFMGYTPACDRLEVPKAMDRGKPDRDGGNNRNEEEHDPARTEELDDEWSRGCNAFGRRGAPMREASL